MSRTLVTRLLVRCPFRLVWLDFRLLLDLLLDLLRREVGCCPLNDIRLALLSLLE